MSTLSTLILASNSPRRRQLLALGGWTFDVHVADIDESVWPAESPRNYVERLAREKVCAIAVRSPSGAVIIGADTTVVIDGEILGKPADAAEARLMLTRLRGRIHQVYTGIAALRLEDGELLSDVVLTDVPMRAYSQDEMERYIQSGDPLDKAGAYGIQNPAFQPVENMKGCYASVMGLPLCSLARLLRRLGISPGSDVAANCQATLAYRCRSPLRLESNGTGF
ncbi:MAG: Maf family nucleotide pyrophosphatase [Anaerolineales bacterium]